MAGRATAQMMVVVRLPCGYGPGPGPEWTGDLGSSPRESLAQCCCVSQTLLLGSGNGPSRPVQAIWSCMRVGTCLRVWHTQRGGEGKMK